MEEAWELAAVKVFLSWSGDYSRDVANLFAEWIPCVLQQVDVFMSTNAIDAGDRWNDVISAALDDIDFGILFVTDENKEKPWLLFEAGALAKNVSRSKVVPILIDTKEIDLSKSPLFGFQYSEMNKDGVFSVMRSVYNSLPDPIIDRDTLTKCLEKWWADLDEKYQNLEKPKKQKTKKPLSEEDRIQRIEETMSDMLSMLSRISRGANRPTKSPLMPKRYTHHFRGHVFEDISYLPYSTLTKLIDESKTVEDLDALEIHIIESEGIPKDFKKDLIEDISDKKAGLLLG